MAEHAPQRSSKAAEAPTASLRRAPAKAAQMAPAAPTIRLLPAASGSLPLFRLPAPQAKPKVGSKDDPAEREADAVAERVGSGTTQRAPVAETSLAPQRQADPQVQKQDGNEVQKQDEPRTQQKVDELQKLPAVNDSPRMSDATAATINSPGPGSPIPTSVRGQIEPHINASLSGVSVHQDAPAQHAAANLGARAFTYGDHIFLAKNESSHDVRLMAHESTHVVQQGAAVRASEDREVQRLPSLLLEELNGYARHIPGYTLYTVILGFNPLLGSVVERNAVNLLEGLMGLVPFGTAIFDTLVEYGVIQDAFRWVQTRLASLDLSLARIERTLEAAWADVRLIEGFEYNLNVVRRHFGAIYSDVLAFAQSLVTQIISLIKSAALDFAEQLLADNRAWALIKKVIHYDPLRDLAVDASTAEILADFLLLIDKQEELNQMRERGTLQETADWLDTQLATFMGLLAELRGLVTSAWSAIQPENLVNLGASLRTLADQAIGFLGRVSDFALTVAAKVLELVKHALLAWASEHAHEVPGFHLLTVLLGKNPITQEEVPRTAENIIKGFITLLPGGEAQYEQLSQTGVITQAAQRIEGAMAELGISWEVIVGLFTGIWSSLTIDDLVHPLDAFMRVREQFGEPIGRLFTFIRVVIEEIFKLILQLMNFPTDLIQRIIANALQAYDDIRRDPVAFFKHMLEAVKLGFGRFFDHITTHLIGGLADWLFRGLRQAGVEPPTEITFESILNLVLQVLGLSMDRIWQKLGERYGEETIGRIRSAIDRVSGALSFVRDVRERGFIAVISEQLQSQLSNLWDMLLAKARDWIMETIINRVVAKIVSMLDPTGIMAVVNSFLAFFNAVQSAIEYLREILQIVDEYVATIAAIARGDVDPGAEKMERGLASAIPVAIGFLANQVGLGDVATRISEIIHSLRGLVDRALDWLIDRVDGAVRSLLRSFGIGGNQPDAPDVANMTPDQKKAGAKNEVEQALVAGISETQLPTYLAQVKGRWALSDIQFERNGDDAEILYFASAPIKTQLHGSGAQAAGGATGTRVVTPGPTTALKTPYQAVKDVYQGATLESAFKIKEETWDRASGATATKVGPITESRNDPAIVGQTGHIGQDEYNLVHGGGSPAYHGGHLIGFKLLGSLTQVGENVAPQIPSFNTGTYQQWEGMVRESPVSNPQTGAVEVKVDLSYGAPRQVPHAVVKSMLAPNTPDRGPVTVPRFIPSGWQMEMNAGAGQVLAPRTASASSQMHAQAQPGATTSGAAGFVWHKLTAGPATTIGGKQTETLSATQRN